MTVRSIFERLRADHDRVLAELDALEQAAGITEPRLNETELLRVLALLAFQFGTHMAAEDEVIFPALARALPESLGRLEPFGVEHEELRSMLAALEALVARPSKPSRNEQIAVQVRDFVDLLRIHVRKEEALVFRVAERLLAPVELKNVANRLARGAAERAHSIRVTTKGKRP